MSSSLPEGFRARAAAVGDAPAINELVVAADEAVQGWSDRTEGDLLDWWRMVDLENDSWVVEDGDGPIAAYAVIFPHGETAELDGFVHPARKGIGLGGWLIARGEERVRELVLPKIHGWSLAQDQDARRLFESVGYREVRRFYQMLIELDGPPPPARWPEGIHVETFRIEEARAFHDALVEAFAEEWNFVAMPFERWYELRVEAPDFDPTLWFVVREGDEIAGVLRGEPERSGAGLVAAIGVRKPWRKRGIGLALLQHAFGEFYRRGQPRIALGVDAENPTGATRLYERAGMHVAYAAVTYEKELA
jgi:GNAT superfamily N-acetyltransferase